MRKKWLLGASIAVFVMCLLVPATALAKVAKTGSGIRGVSRGYVIHAGESQATISGRLVYRKSVRRGHKKVTVDVRLSGSGVYLLRRSESTGRWIKVAWAAAPGGVFHLHATSGGDYLVRFVGTKSVRPSDAETNVEVDDLAIQNLRGLQASREASGDLFVTLSADFVAPAGVLTTATPGAAIFMVANGLGNPIAALIGGGIGLMSTPTNAVIDDPVGGFSNGFLQVLRKSGTYHYGFNVPADQGDQVFSVMCMFLAGSQYTVPASANATFTPNEILVR